MLRSRTLRASLLACGVVVPSLASAAPATDGFAPPPLLRLWAAGSGEVITVPGSAEKAELLDLEPTLVDGLLAVGVEREVRVADWPVAPGEREEVLLTRHDVYAPGAVIWEVDKRARRQVPRSRLVFLWGESVSDSSTRVMVSVDPATRELRGFMVTSQGIHELLPTPSAWRAGARYLVGPRDLLIDAKGRAARNEWRCGEEELPLPLDRLLASPQGRGNGLHAIYGKAGISSLHTAIVAVDTDNEIMLNKFADNTTTASNYIASLFASMNVIYERDVLVRLLQGTTFLRRAFAPDSDPWVVGGSDSNNTNKLFEFTNYWSANYNAINRALALMLSGRGGSGAAGVAWIDVLCNKTNGYAFSRVSLGGTSPNFGDVLVTAHEIGHNFGSPHTHCYNTLGLTNPDNCYDGEAGAGCFGGTPSCPSPATYSGIPNVTGTLMSYCHLLGGCSSSLVFHPTTVDLLDDKILSRTMGGNACIFPNAPPVPTVSAVNPNNGTTAGGVAVTINGSNFESGATVSLGGGAATSVVVVNASTITAVTPAHATGAVTVTVTNPSTLAGSLASAFFYAPPAATTSFFTLTPCRILDTRNPNGQFGGPALLAQAVRTFTIAGTCGIPANAVAISANVTVVAGSGAGSFSLFPGNAFPLGTTTLYFTAGRVRASNSILELATDGAGTIGILNASTVANHLILDVNGYFLP